MVYNDYANNLIKNIPLGIAISDVDGFIKYGNLQLLNMFGYELDEILGKSISNLFDRFNHIKSELLNNHYIKNQEVNIHSRKNKLRFSLSAFQISIVDSDEFDIIYIFEDIKKERKLANKILENRAIYTFDKMITKNKDFINLINFAKKVADSKSTIMIMGESGTGKEVFAQSIHNYSNRKDHPFIAINSAAIPKNLIESELFGYEEGAFTGAKKTGQAGKFELAHKGTIFLDEIGEMPLDLQTRLLRVIEEGVVSRIGGTEQIIVDVRIIAASNKNLKQEVAEGRFRKDLFYRLNVLPMTILPLRDRKEDIPLLIQYFMKKTSRRLNKREVPISDEELEKMMEYSWPGNVRELENLMELIINLEDVPKNLFNEETNYKYSEQLNYSEDLSLDSMEKNHIIRVLNTFEGNITKSAEALGIGRNTLYRKIEKYNIDCSKTDYSSIMEQ